MSFPWLEGKIYAKLESLQVIAPLRFAYVGLLQYGTGFECSQDTGSFKARGALCKVLAMSRKELNAGVFTASAGNHALGVLNAVRIANERGLAKGARAKIYLPGNVTQAKEMKLR